MNELKCMNGHDSKVAGQAMNPSKNSILVVEDDASNRFMLGLTLRQAGYRVEMVPNAVEALEFLKRRPFCWMITDGKMEEMDGLELSRQAKGLQPDLRIVMVSAVYTNIDIRDFPIETLFPKPVATEALLGWLAG